MTTKDSTLTIGVLDVDGLHLRDKPVVPISGAIRHVGDLYNGARRHGLAQLWLTDAWVEAAGLPDSLRGARGRPRHLAHPFVTDGLPAAELHAWPEGLSHWLALDKKGVAGVAVVIPAYDDNATWGEGIDADTLLAALYAYANAVGRPYVRSPGKTGLDLLIETTRRGGKRDAVEDWPPPALDTNTVRDLTWMRTLTPEERGRAYLHSYDKNALWLGAASSVELGLGDVEERSDPGDGTGVAFDKRLPGYWLARLGGAEERWHCTPTVARAIERGQAVAIGQAYVWPRRARALEGWYERLRDARATLKADPAPPARLALDVLKYTYAVTVSTLGGTWYKHDDPLYRPDWRHHIIAQANANLSRALGRLEAAGVPVVAVNVDCAYVVSDEPDPVAAMKGTLKLGEGLGDFKVRDAAIPLVAVVEAFDPERQRGEAAVKALTRLIAAAGGTGGGSGEG
jgi:hypothetical protein